MNEGAAIAWSLRVIIAVTAVVPVTAVVWPSSQMKPVGSQTRSGRVVAGFAACPRSAHDLICLKARTAGGYERPMHSRRRDRHDEPALTRVAADPRSLALDLTGAPPL